MSYAEHITGKDINESQDEFLDLLKHVFHDFKHNVFHCTCDECSMLYESYEKYRGKISWKL